MVRDWESHTGESRYALQVFPTTNIKGGPGADFRSVDGTFRAAITPTSASSGSSSGTPATDTSLTIGLARLWFEAWPIATPTYQYLQLTFDFAYRTRLGGDPDLPKQLSDFAAGANLYLDGIGHVGIGIDYANGKDATQRFAKRERTSIGLKLKF